MRAHSFWSKLAASLTKDRPFDRKAATYAALFLMLAYMLLLLIPTLASWSEKIATGRQPEFGTDFLSFYAASALALAGQPADVYNQALHLAALPPALMRLGSVAAPAATPARRMRMLALARPVEVGVAAAVRRGRARR